MGKENGIKVRSYWEHVEEHIGNLGNMLRTQWKLWMNIIMESKRGEKKNILIQSRNFWARDLMDFAPCPPQMFQGVVIRNDTK
jgi:hypothetical protein